MAFVVKDWTDRITEYPNRRKLIKEDGSSEVVNVERYEGTVLQEGYPYSAENMNDFEQRVQDGFNNAASTISNGYVDIGVDNCTEVSASVCMTKLSPNIANIVINYKICSNTFATDVYRFIDMDKLKVALGLSYLGFPIGASTVILHSAVSCSNGTLTEETAYADAEQRGLTGLMMGEGGGLCRIYQIGSTAGAWPLNCAMYKPGTYGTIIINGATIA